MSIKVDPLNPELMMEYDASILSDGRKPLTGDEDPFSRTKPKRIRKQPPRSPEVVIACMEYVIGLESNRGPGLVAIRDLLDELKRALRK